MMNENKIYSHYNEKYKTFVYTGFSFMSVTLSSSFNESNVSLGLNGSKLSSTFVRLYNSRGTKMYDKNTNLKIPVQYYDEFEFDLIEY